MKVGGTWLCVQSNNEVPHCHKANVTKNTMGGPISPARWKWSLNSVYLFEGLLFTSKQMGREWSSQLINTGLLGVWVAQTISHVHMDTAGHCWTHCHAAVTWGVWQLYSLATSSRVENKYYARSSACVNW